MNRKKLLPIISWLTFTFLLSLAFITWLNVKDFKTGLLAVLFSLLSIAAFINTGIQKKESISLSEDTLEHER